MKPSIFIIILLLLSCRGTVSDNTLTATAMTMEIGKPVTEIHPNAGYLIQDQKQQYWFAHREAGVYRMEGDNITLFTVEDGLCSAQILSVQEDASGILYFDTTEGVCTFDGETFTTLPVAATSASENEWTLAPNDLWFRMGWDHGGPFRYDGEKLFALAFPENPMEATFRAMHPNVTFNPYGVYSIYKAHNGELWFGTSSLGVYRYDGKKLRWMYEHELTETPEGGSFGFRSIGEDAEGYFWISNSAQKFKMLPDASSEQELLPIHYEKENGALPLEGVAPYIFSMVTDKQGDLWFATGEGAWKKTGTELIHYPILENGQNIPLFTIHIDRQGTLWASSYNQGTFRFNGTEFVKFMR